MKKRKKATWKCFRVGASPTIGPPERVGGKADVLEGVIGQDVEGKKRQRDEASHQPCQPHRQVGVSCSRGPAGGVKDQLVTLQSDQHQGEDGDGYRHALDEGGHLLEQETWFMAVSHCTCVSKCVCVWACNGGGGGGSSLG